jgi:hypothetical protein
MRIYLFKSEVDAEVFGFTIDETGANLPDRFAPWRSFGDLITSSSKPLLGIGLTATATIKRDGFYLARSGLVVSRIPETRSPN